MSFKGNGPGMNQEHREGPRWTVDGTVLLYKKLFRTCAILHYYIHCLISINGWKIGDFFATHRKETHINFGVAVYLLRNIPPRFLAPFPYSELASKELPLETTVEQLGSITSIKLCIFPEAEVFKDCGLQVNQTRKRTVLTKLQQSSNFPHVIIIKLECITQNTHDKRTFEDWEQFQINIVIAWVLFSLDMA